MSKINLKQIIREEIKNVLSERSVSDAYKNNEKEMKSTILKPGIYNISDSDVYGYRNSVDFNIKLTKPMNKWDIAMELYDKKKYISGWGILNIKKSNGKPEITIGSGKQLDMFDKKK